MKDKKIVFCKNGLQFMVEEQREEHPSDSCLGCGVVGGLYYLWNDQISVGICLECMKKQYIMVKDIADMDMIIKEIVESRKWVIKALEEE